MKSEIVNFQTHGQRAGEWTDDTSMALCLATSRLSVPVLTRRIKWSVTFSGGEKDISSVRDHCFDIGTTVAAALRRFLETGEAFAGSTDPYSAGNGSLMRLAPIPLFFYKNPRLAIEQCGESSRTTHGARAAVDACRYYGGPIVGALHGVSKEQLLSSFYSPEAGIWSSSPLVSGSLRSPF